VTGGCFLVKNLSFIFLPKTKCPDSSKLKIIISISRRLSYAICFESGNSRSGTDDNIRQFILGILVIQQNPIKKSDTTNEQW